MMRRSKRQNKATAKSVDEATDTVEQQQQSKAIQKKIKRVPQQNEEAQNNFQFAASSTKRELDSVVVNLAAQLEKASNSLDTCEGGRPKRIRKITEKAEQELLAKQNKVKALQKKHSSDNHKTDLNGESISTQNKTRSSSSQRHAQGRKPSSQLSNVHDRSRKAESAALGNQQNNNLHQNQLHPHHSDEHDMDIENLHIYDSKTVNTLAQGECENKHSLQQESIDDDMHHDEQSMMDEEEEDDQSHSAQDDESDEIEHDDEDDEDEHEDRDQESNGHEEEDEEEEACEDDMSEIEDKEDALVEKGTLNSDDTILKASTKINQQLGDESSANIQNKLNQKDSNKIVKKRSASHEKSAKNLISDVSQNQNIVECENNQNQDENSNSNKMVLEGEQSNEQQPNSDAHAQVVVPSIPLLKKKQKSLSKKLKQQEKEENAGNEDKQIEDEQDDDEEEDENDDNGSSEDDEDDENKNEDDEEEGGKDGSNSSKAKKMPWSEEEDKLVIRLVEQHGPQKWTFIAQHIPGRIGKQCRERWHNHLNPKINKDPWGDDEEWILFLCHRLKGNKWAEITQYLPGRTDNAIKNHWNSSMKKRIPELYQRFALIKRGESPEYDITTQYKKFEDEILKQLLAMSDEGVEQYFVQTTRRRRNNANLTVAAATASTPTNAQATLPSIKPAKLKNNQEGYEEKNEDDQELPAVPLAKKMSKAAIKAAAKQAALAEKQQLILSNEENNGSSLNNHFTPNNNNKSQNNNFKTLPNSAAASTADVKEIIQRIPHNIKEFENFRKQIILYSDEYYQNHMLQQTPNDKESSLNILSAEKGITTDVNLSDTKHLEKILETPLTVENYVQQNPAFADIVRSALKYSSCSKNLTFMSHVKKNSNFNGSENTANTDHNQLSATSTLLSTIQQDKSSLPNLDQSPDDDLLSSAKNGIEKIKKKRGRKPKAMKEQESAQQVSSNTNNNNAPKNMNHQQNPNGMKKMIHGPPYMHPMYMMNPHHPHPYYANHPHHPSYLPPPPPPHMMGHGQQMPHMQGYHHPHHMQHPIPPPHMQHPHYMRDMRGGQMNHHHHPPPPPPHHQSMRGGPGGQGHMMMPPPPPHHLQQMRMRHPGMPHPHPMYMGGNNSIMRDHSDSSENSNFQTPQKYQKTNQGDRSLFKSITPIIPPNSEKQLKFDDKLNNNNKLKHNTFNNDDDYNNFMVNNSFSKENIHPNIQHISMASSKEPVVALGGNTSSNVLQNNNTSSNNNNQNTSNTNANNSSSNNSQNSSNNNHGNSNGVNLANNLIQNHNHNFITPNKYETPSKLLDFDSEPRINCNSVDKYFNIRNYSSNHKSNNLYTNHHVNNFQHSSNSAFKCYPHMSMDYQDTPSAKKQSYC